METTLERVLTEKSKTAEFKHDTVSLSLMQRYNKFIEDLEFSHFSVIAMAILIGSCLGSITAMFVFFHGAPTWVFAIGLFATMANLVACISQAPTKWVVNLFLLSVLVNLILIAIYPVF